MFGGLLIGAQDVFRVGSNQEMEQQDEEDKQQ